MCAKEHSNYQKGVINRYYANLDNIMLTNLANIVTDLYLAETKAKYEKLWERAEKAMKKLKIPQPIIDHIMEKRSVEILAKNLQDWQK